MIFFFLSPVTDNRASLLRPGTAPKKILNEKDISMHLWKNYTAFACRVVPSIPSPVIRCVSPDLMLSSSPESLGIVVLFPIKANKMLDHCGVMLSVYFTCHYFHLSITPANDFWFITVVRNWMGLVSSWPDQNYSLPIYNWIQVSWRGLLTTSHPHQWSLQRSCTRCWSHFCEANTRTCGIRLFTRWAGSITLQSWTSCQSWLSTFAKQSIGNRKTWDEGGGEMLWGEFFELELIIKKLTIPKKTFSSSIPSSFCLNQRFILKRDGCKDMK